MGIKIGLQLGVSIASRADGLWLPKSSVSGILVRSSSIDSTAGEWGRTVCNDVEPKSDSDDDDDDATGAREAIVFDLLVRNVSDTFVTNNDKAAKDEVSASWIVAHAHCITV